MGQKVHPTGFRLGYIRDHDATWFADRNYAQFVVEDMLIRRYLDRFAVKRPLTVARNEEERQMEKALANASISRIEISRSVNTVTLTIHSAKPGVLIGRAGRGIEVLRTLLQRLTRRQVQIDVTEERDPDLDARLVAEKISSQLTRRISFRRAVRQAVEATKRAGAAGVKVIVSGRLAGGDMARTFVQKTGSIPLQTIRADIDYGFCEAPTTYGNIGVKVWIYRGEKLPTQAGVGLEVGAPAVVLQPEPVEEPVDEGAKRGRRRVRRRRAGQTVEPVAEGASEVEAEPAVGDEEAADLLAGEVGPAMAPPPAEAEPVDDEEA